MQIQAQSENVPEVSCDYLRSASQCRKSSGSATEASALQDQRALFMKISVLFEKNLPAGRLSRTKVRWTALDKSFDMAMSEVGVIILDSEIFTFKTSTVPLFGSEDDCYRMKAE
jgi:hypothetical protein